MSGKRARVRRAHNAFQRQLRHGMSFFVGKLRIGEWQTLPNPDVSPTLVNDKPMTFTVLSVTKDTITLSGTTKTGAPTRE